MKLNAETAAALSTVDARSFMPAGASSVPTFD
jgi:hypothetical protein